MVVIERTRDWELIKAIVTDHSVYPKVSDDSSPPPEIWEPLKDDAAYYLLVKNGDDVLGLFFVMATNGVTFQVHTCLLPQAYGAKAAEAAQKLIEWVFANTNCLRLVTEVPVFNKLALRFAEKAGMEKYGYNPKSFSKENILYGVIMLGISKEGVYCQ